MTVGEFKTWLEENKVPENASLTFDPLRATWIPDPPQKICGIPVIYSVSEYDVPPRIVLGRLP